MMNETHTHTPPFEMDVTKLLAEFKMPGVDLESIMATQRKNIEALSKANQLALEGMQTMARRQSEILRGGFERASTMMRDIMQTQSTEDRVMRQTEAAKHTVELALSNARELAEIMTRAGNEAFDVLHHRVEETLDEVRDAVAKRGAGPNAGGPQ
jgi:phasin family protein